MPALHPRRPRFRGLLTLSLFVLGLVLCCGVGSRRVAAQTAPVVLLPGWNNFAYLGPPQPVTAGLAGIAGQFDALWHFDATTQSWQSFNPMAPESSDFGDLTEGAAYWIHMLQPGTLPIGQAGVQPVGTQPLYAGWNNIAQGGPTAAVTSALGPYNATYTVVWHWNPSLQRWELFDPTAGTVSDFQALVQGQAYWVNVVSGTPGAPNVAPGAAASCYPFQSYQPQYAEVADALNRAGNNGLIDDPAFRLADAHIDPAGGPATMSGYIPPTLLKAIAWIESGWRQATYSVQRGGHGATIVSRSCAYGVSQVLTGMQVNNGKPTDRQNLIGSDYIHNIGAGAQILLSKWNMAPAALPVYGRRDPHIIEDWYFATWAYHCYGDMCSRYNVHDNPDDPTLKWPRPAYGSPDQKNSNGAFSATDYPYQELVYGLIANPPVQDGAPLWQAIPVQLPAHGMVGFPVPANQIELSAHLEGGAALAVPTTSPPPASPSPAPAPAPSATPAPAATPRPSGNTVFPAVGGG
jgi:hypothetical protein